MTTPIKRPTALIILDGFGYRTDQKDNAITPQTMPFFFDLLKKYPWTTLAASGQAVGLLPGMAGNSAVGHFTLGAGATVEQPLTQFIRMIHDGSLAKLPVIQKRFTELAASGKTLHILGLMSDGNAHSRLEFTQAIIKIARQYGIKDILVHAILDGRDVPQKSAAEFLKKIDALIATIQGRLYAMDRNNDMQRIQQGYDIFVHPAVCHPGLDPGSLGWQTALDAYYKQGLYDEIIPPTQLIPGAVIHKGDGLVFVNIRADREREMYELLKGNNDLSFIITGINYDHSAHAETMCTTPHSTSTLNDYLEKHKISLFTVAESEKYAHVTYFFNGGRQTIRPNETRVIIPSDNPETFKDEPAMKAHEITQAVLADLRTGAHQFYLVNYANADMVGHTGDLQATQKACAILDMQLEKLYHAFVEEHNGTLYITGDHGNAEDKHNHNPAHTTNPVYFMIVSDPHCPSTLLNGLQTIADVKDIIIENSLS